MYRISSVARLVDPFFITGHPRSRTAWMAAFLTDGDVFCHHELMNKCSTHEQFYSEMAKGVGNSDSGLCFTDFQQIMPTAPTVVIVRPYKEMKRSMERLYGRPMDFGGATIENIKGLRVSFKNLDRELPSICEYIGVPYNKPRHDMFKHFNIQTTDITPRGDALRIWG